MRVERIDEALLVAESGLPGVRAGRGETVPAVRARGSAAAEAVLRGSEEGKLCWARGAAEVAPGWASGREAGRLRAGLRGWSWEALRNCGGSYLGVVEVKWSWAW